MIVHKFWSAFVAQINKIANLFFEADPIAIMQLEVDQATERLKEGRKGLEMYRGLVETVARQVVNVGFLEEPAVAIMDHILGDS